MNDVTDAGILTTASDLLFSGGREGYFLRARCAQRRTAVEGEPWAAPWPPGPMTYAVNGRQYVAISAGSSLFVYALRSQQ